MPMFEDLADKAEDDRIEAIGFAAVGGRIIAVCVDKEGADGYEKADRYARKLTARFPSLRMIDRFEGPVKDVVTFRVGSKEVVK